MTQDLPYRQNVGLCLFNKQGQVFCAERRETRGAWQMPQGGIQDGEDKIVAAKRELKEEIGTDHATIIGCMNDSLRYDFPMHLQYHNGVFCGKYKGQEQTWFALLFEGDDSEIDLTLAPEPEGPEFVAWKWMSLSDMPSLIVPFKRGVYEKVVCHFEPLESALKRGETPPPLK